MTISAANPMDASGIGFRVRQRMYGNGQSVDDPHCGSSYPPPGDAGCTASPVADYSAPLGAGPGGYVPPLSWTETTWPETPGIVELPPFEPRVEPVHGVSTYDDMLSAQRLVEDILVERLSETDHSCSSDSPRPVDRMWETPLAVGGETAAVVGSEPFLPKSLVGDESDPPGPSVDAGLEGFLEEPQPDDLFLLLATPGITEHGP